MIERIELPDFMVITLMFVREALHEARETDFPSINHNHEPMMRKKSLHFFPQRDGFVRCSCFGRDVALPA